MSQISRQLTKICLTCGRQISWRKKWEKNWDAISYCSNSCRKNKIKPNSLDMRFEQTILNMLKERKEAVMKGKGGTKNGGILVTCEEAEAEALVGWKEVGRVDDEELDLGTDEIDAEEKHDALGKGKVTGKRERCRQAARRLAARGEIIITQNGKVTDPSFTKGIMELRFPES